MQGVSNRTAQFRTVICLLGGTKEYYFEGVVKGSITQFSEGEKGFGYDPVFLPEGYAHTFAEMELAEKNKISHRGKAVNSLVQFLHTTQP